MRENKATHSKSRSATLASRTMMLSGLTVLAFVAYHLAHYTLGITNPEYATLQDNLGRYHIYNMVVMGFSNIWVSVLYSRPSAACFSPESTAFRSAARTLGLSNAKRFKVVKFCGQIFCVGARFVIYVYSCCCSHRRIAT